jgi:hypothetical protein
MAKGFYSLVQYCPNRFRAEAVNIGLVLVCVEPHAVRVRMTDRFDRVRKLFSMEKSDVKDIKFSSDSLRSRIESSVDQFVSAEDLLSFAAARANDLRMTEPRLAKLMDIDQDFDRLYADLVDAENTSGGQLKESPTLLPPELNDVFCRLQREHKIWDPKPITVPILRRKLDVPYAFQNGAVNLVSPQVFAGNRRAESNATNLAVTGNLVQKHGIDGERYKLIVVSTVEDEKQKKEIDRHIEPLLNEYGVRLIRPSTVAEFAAEVERTAH